MSDTELFELCEDVKERTGWVDKTHVMPDGSIRTTYTSDYLLEKLPDWANLQKIGNDTGAYIASYDAGRTFSNGDTELAGRADTPLKALLKLVIALDDAGELKL